jgi:hypothetical protein
MQITMHPSVNREDVPRKFDFVLVTHCFQIRFQVRTSALESLVIDHKSISDSISPEDLGFRHQ